jgi:hypothetical protein
MLEAMRHLPCWGRTQLVRAGPVLARQPFSKRAVLLALTGASLFSQPKPATAEDLLSNSGSEFSRFSDWVSKLEVMVYSWSACLRMVHIATARAVNSRFSSKHVAYQLLSWFPSLMLAG